MFSRPLYNKHIKYSTMRKIEMIDCVNKPDFTLSLKIVFIYFLNVIQINGPIVFISIHVFRTLSSKSAQNMFISFYLAKFYLNLSCM